MMTFIGVLAVLAGGSSAGYRDPFGALASLLAFVVCTGLLYAYWACGVYLIVWFGQHVIRVAPGSEAAAWLIMVALMGPIMLPMLIASVIQGLLHWRRAQS